MNCLVCNKVVSGLWSVEKLSVDNIIIVCLETECHDRMVSLFHIWDVPGSNLGPDTGYSDRFYVVFLSLQAHMGVVPKIRPI
jgi:hypothetical protein